MTREEAFTELQYNWAHFSDGKKEGFELAPPTIDDFFERRNEFAKNRRSEHKNNYELSENRQIVERRSFSDSLALSNKNFETRVELQKMKLAKKKVDLNIWITFRFFFAFAFWATTICLLALFALDASAKIKRETDKARLQAETCHLEFLQNACDKPLPALRAFCLEKEKCFTADPGLSVTRVKQVALVAAETLNSVVAHCEPKTLAFVALIVAIYFLFGSCASSKTRKPRYVE